MLPKVLLPGMATPTAQPDCPLRPSMLLKMPYQQGVLISLGKTKVKIGTNLQSISQAGGVFISFWRSPAKLGEKFQQKLWSAKQWDNTKDHCSLSLPMIFLEMIENLICIYFPVFLLLHEVEYIFICNPVLLSPNSEESTKLSIHSLFVMDPIYCNIPIVSTHLNPYQTMFCCHSPDLQVNFMLPAHFVHHLWRKW